MTLKSAESRGLSCTIPPVASLLCSNCFSPGHPSQVPLCHPFITHQRLWQIARTSLPGIKAHGGKERTHCTDYAGDPGRLLLYRISYHCLHKPMDRERLLSPIPLNQRVGPQQRHGLIEVSSADGGEPDSSLILRSCFF